MLEVLKQARNAFVWNLNTDLDNIPACDQWAKMLRKNIDDLDKVIAEFDSHTLYREGYVNGYAFGEAAGRKAVAEKQDGACQHCAGKGCVACDARKVAHDVF